jgi:hypothetical protein
MYGALAGGGCGLIVPKRGRFWTPPYPASGVLVLGGRLAWSSLCYWGSVAAVVVRSAPVTAVRTISVRCAGKAMGIAAVE